MAYKYAPDLTPGRTPAGTAYGRFGSGYGDGAEGAGGWRSGVAGRRAAAQRPKNPWAEKYQDIYGQAGKSGYGDQWKTGVAQAMALGGKDYEGDLRRMANADIDKQYTAQGNTLGALGMRELQARGDVQDQWAQTRTDSGVRAAMSAQQMKQAALASMGQMLQGAGGAELAKIEALLAAAGAGSGDERAWMAQLIPLMQQYGQAGGEVK